MIPKYFRCGDPSQSCPLSVTKEILKEDQNRVCPCANPNCVDFRESVPFVEGVTGGRSWIVYGGVAALALVLLFFFLFAGNDPCKDKLRDYQARLATIEKSLVAMESKPHSGNDSSFQLNTVVLALNSDTSKFGGHVNESIAAGNEGAINQQSADVKQRIASATRLRQSFDKPEAGSGVDVAEAKSLIAKLLPLEEEVDAQAELSQTRCPKHVGQFEDMRSNIAATLSKARRIAVPAKTSTQGSDDLKARVDQCISELKAIQSKLASVRPQPKKPFEPDLRIAAAPDLAKQLGAPLAAAWVDSKTIQGPEGAFYIDGGPKKRIVVKPSSPEQGFESLAAGEIDLFFADRAPTSAELARFGSDFKESTSVAQVIALDALTLLVHPDNTMDTFEVGKPVSLVPTLAPEGSDLRRRAYSLGIPSTLLSGTSDGGEVLPAKDALKLSLFHTEEKNLRAKRLAVKASPQATPLKPSPFTIATKEYLYTYQIVAWTPTKPADEALAFVQFITSDPGQGIVEQCRFVDLRLKPIIEIPRPEILAALGRALGVDKVSSAQRLSTNIQFAVGDSQFDIKARADLVRIPPEVYSKYPNHVVVILGFTDSDGGPGINRPLSVRRAETVAAELRRSKVDARAEGLGDSFPIDTNGTDAGKARNRRAEVWVVKP